MLRRIIGKRIKISYKRYKKLFFNVFIGFKDDDILEIEFYRYFYTIKIFDRLNKKDYFGAYSYKSAPILEPISLVNIVKEQDSTQHATHHTQHADKREA